MAEPRHEVPYAEDGLSPAQGIALRQAVAAAVGAVELTFVAGESELFGF